RPVEVEREQVAARAERELRDPAGHHRSVLDRRVSELLARIELSEQRDEALAERGVDPEAEAQGAAGNPMLAGQAESDQDRPVRAELRRPLLVRDPDLGEADLPAPVALRILERSSSGEPPPTTEIGLDGCLRGARVRHPAFLEEKTAIAQRRNGA